MLVETKYLVNHNLSTLTITQALLFTNQREVERALTDFMRYFMMALLRL